MLNALMAVDFADQLRKLLRCEFFQKEIQANMKFRFMHFFGTVSVHRRFLQERAAFSGGKPFRRATQYIGQLAEVFAFGFVDTGCPVADGAGLDPDLFSDLIGLDAEPRHPGP